MQLQNFSSWYSPSISDFLLLSHECDNICHIRLREDVQQPCQGRTTMNHFE